MKSFSCLLASALVCLIVSPLTAANVTLPPQAKKVTPFDRLDTNHDGKLTIDEFKRIASLKHNGNGQFTGNTGNANQHLTKLFEKIDQNKDGVISRAEFHQFMASHHQKNGQGGLQVKK